jgi:pimeloyl-ACP methyl ester carboxylesterase
MPALAPHATVYAVDQLGTGYSDRPANLDCSVRAIAERLLRFLDHAGVSSFDLLGTSHGGGGAIMAASLAPRRVRRLILVAPVNPWSKRGTMLSTFLSNQAIAPLFLRLAPHLEITHEFFLRRMYGDPRRISPGTLKGYQAPVRIPGAYEYSMSVLRSWNQDLEEIRLALPRIAEIPTLLIWGDKDTAVNPKSASPLRKQFADCRLQMLQGVGHLPYEEVPEEFNRIVLEFLQSTAAQ